MHHAQFFAGDMGQHALERCALRQSVGARLEAQFDCESNVSVQIGHRCLLVMGSHLNDT